MGGRVETKMQQADMQILSCSNPKKRGAEKQIGKRSLLHRHAAPGLAHKEPHGQAIMAHNVTVSSCPGQLWSGRQMRHTVALQL